jgi:hypothetical protein
MALMWVYAPIKTSVQPSANSLRSRKRPLIELETS